MEEKVVRNIRLDDILPNRFQPRIKFDEDAIMELADSIKEHGVIQPIIVREIGDRFEIIAGERRYKASVLIGNDTIPAIVNNLDDQKSAEIALIENVQRQDLTPIEEAVSYKKILDMGYLTQEELAAKIDKKQSTVSNKLRLLNLADEVQEALLNEQISERHARSLLKLASLEKQIVMLNKIIKERLTVRKTDVEIDKMMEENNQVIEDIKVTVPEVQAIPSNLNIPTQPIVNDEVEELDMDDIFDIEDVKTDYNFEATKFHPGFLDIDAIEKTAQDIVVEKPLVDIEELLRGTASTEVEEKIVQNSFNSGKFFTFPTPQLEEVDEPRLIIDTMQDFNFIPSQPKAEVKETVDFKVVINTVHDLASKLEKDGFKVEINEEEHDGYYQVTFKIDKNNI